MLLDARPLRESKLKELKARVEKMSEKPHLVIVRVGEDPASEKYVNNKIKMCKEVGVKSTVLHFPEEVTNGELYREISYLSMNREVTGILVQLPLPSHIDEDYILNTIEPSKEVDGFCNENLGKLIRGEKSPVACTPRGIIDLLKYYKIPLEGKDVLIINRSNIVGKPLSQLLLRENATVTIAHSKTKRLKEKIENSDIVITGIGKSRQFFYEDFSPETTIVDVSINFDDCGKLCGDVAKEDYLDLINFKKCNITPVPNGVGITTVLSLIEQVIEMKERSNN